MDRTELRIRIRVRGAPHDFSTPPSLPIRSCLKISHPPNIRIRGVYEFHICYINLPDIQLYLFQLYYNSLMVSILKLNSPIWTYFSCNSDSSKGKRVICNVCKKSFCRAGSSSTPLVNHHRSFHKKAKLLSEEREQENKTVKPSSEMALAKLR